MFGGGEMSYSEFIGNGDVQGQNRLVATLKSFSDLVHRACFAHDIAVGQVPFARPANFMAVLNPDAIHVVVDDVPIGGMPDHKYLDRRNKLPVLPLDALVEVSVRELGFRDPLGVTIPLTANTEDEAQRAKVLSPVVAQLCAQLAKRTRIQQFQLPKGYEHFARIMPAFLLDHADVDHNVFLMMRFRSGDQYDEIHKAVLEGMARHGLSVLRADDKDYTGDLWENVCLYMLGSRYGVAVFEEIDLREFNPNVALELGFMIAHDKRCLLLKDKRMPRMPADVVGKLYKEFDTYDIRASIDKAVDAWTRDMGLYPGESETLWVDSTLQVNG